MYNSINRTKDSKFDFAPNKQYWVPKLRTGIAKGRRYHNNKESYNTYIRRWIKNIQQYRYQSSQNSMIKKYLNMNFVGVAYKIDWSSPPISNL